MADRRRQVDFNALDAEIYARLGPAQMRSLFQTAGAIFKSEESRMRSDGCEECHAIGRTDCNASAMCNLLTGAYCDLGAGKGDVGRSLKELLARKKWGGARDYREVRERLMQMANMTTESEYKTAPVPTPPPAAKQPKKSPAANLAISGWDSKTRTLLKVFCEEHKPGTKPDAVIASGSTPAIYRNRVQVIAQPWHQLDGNICGYTIFGFKGECLPMKYVDGAWICDERKKNTAGSEAGWIGREDLERLDTFPDAVIWKVEGPTDQWAIVSVLTPEERDRVIVLSNCCGAGETPSPPLLEILRGRVVYVCHDADKPGERGAETWSTAIAEFAREVRNVKLPYPVEVKHGKDMRDFVKEGGTYAQLEALAAASPVVVHVPKIAPATLKSGTDGNTSTKPKAEAVEDAADHPENDDLAEAEQVCSKMQIEVLGLVGAGGVEVFSTHCRRTDTIGDIGRLSYDRLVTIGGLPILKFVAKSEERFREGMVVFDDARTAIATLAARNRIEASTKLGCGCWEIPADRDEPPSIVCVGSGEAVEWNGTELRSVMTPRCRGKILDFSSGGKWFNPTTLSACLGNPGGSWAADAIDSLLDILRRWRWKQPYAAEIVAGLVSATWVQSLWEWRPQVSITGASNAGKSSLFQFLASLYGDLADKSAGSTTAGLRQAAGTSSKATFIDEFENNEHRQKTLDMMKLAGRGEKTLRGTTHHRVEEFIVKKIFWAAAIEINLPEEPDANRFIRLELMKPESALANMLEMPSSLEALELGQRMLAAALLHVHAAKRMAESLRKVKVKGVSPRVIESYAVPAAMLALCRGGESAEDMEDSAREWLTKAVAATVHDGSSTPDEVELLETILHSHVRVGHGETKLVSEIVDSNNEHDVECLARDGVHAYVYVEKRADGEAGAFERRIFVAKYASDRLLGNTRWKGKSIEQILLRVPGAGKKRHRMGRGQFPGVYVPREYLVQADILPPIDGETVIPEDREF